MTFNFKDEEAWDTSTDMLLPVGNHIVEIASAESGYAQSSGNPQLELKVSGDTGTMRDWITITPKTVGKVVQVYDAAGVVRPGEGEFDESTGKLFEPAVKRLEGKRVGVVVRDEPDRQDPSKMRRRIFGYVDPARIKASAAQPTAASPAAAPARKDDDIPF